MSRHLARTSNDRPELPAYYLGIAEAVSVRGDCRRSRVGAVLVDALGRIRGTAYNSPRSGAPSCLAGECPRGLRSYEEVAALSSYGPGPGSCPFMVHAEMNLILFTSAADRLGGSIYITREPCSNCLLHCQSSGVGRIQWGVSQHGAEGRWVQQGNGSWKQFDGAGL